MILRAFKKIGMSFFLFLTNKIGMSCKYLGVDSLIVSIRQKQWRCGNESEQFKLHV